MATLSIATAIDPGARRAAANSQSEIRKRLARGEISWRGPLLLVMTRPVLFVFLPLQAALAAVFALLRRPSAWRSAGAWWSVYGTLVDICCLGLMARFTKREHISIRDLIGNVRLRWARHFYRNRIVPSDFSGLHGGSFVSSLLIYGSWTRREISICWSSALPLWSHL